MNKFVKLGAISAAGVAAATLVTVIIKGVKKKKKKVFVYDSEDELDEMRVSDLDEDNTPEPPKTCDKENDLKEMTDADWEAMFADA